MQYSPKLKIAMEEIKAILSRHDIAGAVILHTPGFSEFLFSPTPSWSVARLEPTGFLRIKTNPADPKEVKKKQIEDTMDMISGMATSSMEITKGCKAVIEMLKDRFRFDGGTGDITGHDQQNN